MDRQSHLKKRRALAWLVGFVGVAALGGTLALWLNHERKPVVRITAVGGQPVSGGLFPYGARNTRETAHSEKRIASGDQAVERSVDDPSVDDPSVDDPSVDEFYRAASAVQTLRLDEFESELQRTHDLSDAELARLGRTFKLAAKLQLGIDREADPKRQVERQRNLVFQVVTRLRLVFRDEEKWESVKEALRGLPRLEYSETASLAKGESHAAFN